MGVGLEVCRAIIESHSGKIGVEVNVDAGVTFSFVLPLSNSVREDSSD
jgi:light-regulated signal transduction histidine kinase (bacteriophytochrome)